MAKPGRKTKDYKTSWGVTIDGLARDKDGPWRMISTGKRFTEYDERRAIQKYRKWESQQSKHIERLRLPIQPRFNPFNPKQRLVGGALALFTCAERVGGKRNRHVHHEFAYDGSASISQDVQTEVLWAWLREQLIERPAWVGQQVGIPQLASLANFDMPKAPIAVSKVIEEYSVHCTATHKSKREATKQFERLVAFAKATTLNEATSEEVLVKFRKEIVDDPELTSSETIAAYFSRIRNVIRIAGRGKLDALQIQAAVTRCKAKLYSPPSNVVDNPQPISRENFHILLAGANQTQVAEKWRAMLLMGLNAALYMEDLCDLVW